MKWEIMSWDGKIYTTIHEPDGKRHFVSEDDGKFNKAQVTTIRNRIGRRAYKQWLKEYKESITILERMKFLGADADYGIHEFITQRQIDEARHLTPEEIVSLDLPEQGQIK